MTQKEIDARFDEIVAFSEIEQFIDTEVKHYSSGMFLRLAFSVAIHTELDILLVDEILSVGDEPFQRKCLAEDPRTARRGQDPRRRQPRPRHGRRPVRTRHPDRKGQVVFDGDSNEAVALMRA